MKKLLALLMALMLMLTLTAYGEDAPVSDDSTDASQTVVENEGDATEAEDEEPADDSQDSTWKEFIAEYDAWVDDYIDLLEKYEKNPTDMTILSDYTEMMNDLTEWSDKADEVTEELKDSPEAAAEYAGELAKIAAKLADAAY